MIELRVIGTAEIFTGSAVLTPSQEIAFAATLYLALARGNAVSRSKLAHLLWPEVGHARRSHRLRQTILQLKKLGLVLRSDRNSVQLGQSVTEHGEIVRSILAGMPPVTHSVEFLPGYNPTFSALFGDWVETTRSEFHAMMVVFFVKQIAGARARGDWANVERFAANCLALDPYNEEAVLAKAEAAAMRGSKRKAVSILDEYISDVGDSLPDLRIPAQLLRRRVIERIPEGPSRLNASPVFVGREREMSVLIEAFERARCAHGSTVMLVGEPGIGKTRLSNQLARFAELQGARVQRATCRRADTDRPLSLFIDMVPQLREMPGALGCTPETFAWLRKLTEFEQGADTTTQASVEAEKLFDHLKAALFDLLDSIVDEHCLVFVIEDLQWLDNASANLLVRMTEWSEARRVLLVLNSRTGVNPVLEYAEKVQIEQLVVAPLEAPAATDLLRSIVSSRGDDPDEELIRWCLGVAEGSPFFLQELAQQWLETGRRHVAPPSVTKVIHERLSRLSREALQVLQTSAILGEFATLERVARLLGYRTHQLLSAIEELGKAAMLLTLPEPSGGTEVRIQPRHDFLAAAATSSLSPISITFLHRRTADILESELVHRMVSPALLWACATHRYHGGDTSSAISLRVSCAEHLLDLGLAQDACLAFQQTVEYCVTDADRLKVLSRHARALELNEEWHRSIETLQTCASLAAKLDPDCNEHNDYELLTLEARHRSSLDFAKLLEDTLRCLNSETASAKHRVGVAVLAMKIAVDFGQAEHLDAIFGKVAPLLHEQSVSELQSIEVQTIYRTMRGDGQVPISDLRRLSVVAREAGGELGYSRALATAATACRVSSRYDEGLAFISEALTHASANRLHSQYRELLLGAIALHIAAGRFDRAKAALGEIRNSASVSDSEKERNAINAFEARVALEEEDYVRAERAFSAIDPLSPSHSVSRRGFYLAIELRLRIQHDFSPEVIRPLVTQLEATHSKMRGLGAQDFECHALVLGLCALQQNARAYSVVRAHLNTRRGSMPIPPTLLKVLRSLEPKIATADGASAMTS